MILCVRRIFFEITTFPNSGIRAKFYALMLYARVEHKWVVGDTSHTAYETPSQQPMGNYKPKRTRFSKVRGPRNTFPKAHEEPEAQKEQGPLKPMLVFSL